MTRAPALAFLMMSFIGSCARPAAQAPVAPAASPTVTLVATAELRGTTEPCGCTSDPLGDLARVATIAKGGLLLDAGNLSYEAGVPATRRAQADLKARAIGKIYAQGEVALGPSDLVGGPDVAPPRQACNLRAVLDVPLQQPHVREIGGLRVGIFGVADVARLREANPGLAWRDLSRPLSAPADEAKLAVASLEAEHAEVIVALIALKRVDAQKLMEAVPDIDFGVIGLEVEEGLPTVVPSGSGWLVAPADQGRRVAKLDVARNGAPAGQRLKLTQFDGAAGKARELARLDKRRRELETQLAAWRADKTADPAFVGARQHELDTLVAERDKLAASLPTAPAGPWFSYALVPIKRALPRDPAVAERLHALDRDIGRSNFAAAKDVAPPAAEAGTPSYVGSAACTRCHKTAAAFWKTTRHAQAWKTLVDVDKQYNYDCTGCHVTGWQEPGGSALGSVEKQGLVDIQCEVCHGPGGKHVAEDGLDEPKTIRKAPADGLCRSRCHTLEHSDTFAEGPYLRDVLGAGHGEARRKALGDGPTAHEISQKAKASASAMAQ